MRRKSFALIISVIFCCLAVLTACDLVTALPKPTGLDFNENTKTLTWDKVENAASYKVNVDDELFDAESNFYLLPDLQPGTHTFTVMALAGSNGYANSGWSAPKQHTIEAPNSSKTPLYLTGLSVDNDTQTLTWDNNPNAASYKISIDDAEYNAEDNAETNSYPLSGLLLGTYLIKVKALAGNENYNDSSWSEPIEYESIPDKILIIDGGNLSGGKESTELEALLTDDYNIDEVDVADAPDTLDGLRAYSQIILMNVANSDKEPEFFDLLHYYVNFYGGGLFTVGGDKAYNRDDMYSSRYQEMLPVNCIKYAPILGLILIIDNSGSMTIPIEGMGGKSKLDLAKEGAKNCVDALADGDYVGIITIESNIIVEPITLTPVLYKDRVKNAIDAITPGGGTYYFPAFEAAGKSLDILLKNKVVEKAHILFVSDGNPIPTSNDLDLSKYKNEISKLYGNGITTSAVHVGTYNKNYDVMLEIAELGGLGDGMSNFYDASSDLNKVSTYMRSDTLSIKTQDYIPSPFPLRIIDKTAVVQGVIESEIPPLGGYYNTKAKTGDYSVAIPLAGYYAPVYVQWNYGNGKVGSFMCDLNGTWSDLFLTGTEGIKIIKNIINELLPKKTIVLID